MLQNDLKNDFQFNKIETEIRKLRAELFEKLGQDVDTMVEKVEHTLGQCQADFDANIGQMKTIRGDLSVLIKAKIKKIKVRLSEVFQSTAEKVDELERENRTIFGVIKKWD